MLYYFCTKIRYMKISNTLIAFMLMTLSMPLFSQGLDGRLSIRLRAGSNAISVKDKDNRSSLQYYPADGATRRAKGKGYANDFVTLGANYDFGKGFLKFSPGLWFTGTNVSLYNRDGNYSGNSKYNMTYLQIPLLIKFQSKEIKNDLGIYISAGPQIGVKISESLNTKDGKGDYAHFWSMANYDTNTDPTRGRNGNGGPTALFNPLYLSFMLNGGVEYKLSDDFALFGGLSLDFGITNVMNPNLMFYRTNPNFYEGGEVSITDLLKVRHNLVGIDLGVRF